MNDINGLLRAVKDIDNHIATLWIWREEYLDQEGQAEFQKLINDPAMDADLNVDLAGTMAIQVILLRRQRKRFIAALPTIGGTA